MVADIELTVVADIELIRMLCMYWVWVSSTHVAGSGSNIYLMQTYENSALVQCSQTLYGMELGRGRGR